MRTGTKALLGVVVAVPLVVVLGPPVASAIGLAPVCHGFSHQFSHCSLFGYGDDCALPVSVTSCVPAVEQSDLHLCGGHLVVWNISGAAPYTFKVPGGIAFKQEYPGGFVNERPHPKAYSWRMTGKRGDYDYNVTALDSAGKSCSIDPRISSE